MDKNSISINHLGEYYTAPNGRKRTIEKIAKQKYQGNHPFWYTLSKNRIKKALKLNLDTSFISKSIEEVLKKKAPKEWHRKNNLGNIEILQRFLKMRFYKNLKEMGYTVVSTDKKSIEINGLSVDIKPDIVFFTEENGRKYFGAIVLRYNKSRAFKQINGQLVAEGIKLFLEKEIVEDDDLILPDFCLSVDIFSETVVSAAKTTSAHRKIVYDLCKDIRDKLAS
ncbi:hypothetical protein [Marinifilum sp. D737]|uniref:hypothetical protein n=1 Tax=Marinifilum sp. D737 TaxID=2969628 RepID=UPI002275EAA1|nr:hypothetical protein [Marinifilum sp. D737]MCY1633923.1 hypothetical protein [Marinifilum sp. D737]